MRRVVIGALLGLVPVLAGAAPEAPLERALALVLEVHPEVEARREALQTAVDRPGWSSEVSLSLSQGESAYGTSNTGRAELSVTIPLVGGGQGEAERQARRALAAARADVRKRFLAEVRKLRMLAVEARAARERRQLAEDRLAYRREAVKEGVAEADALWAEAEQLQSAEHAYRQQATELAARIEEVARRFGGAQWTRLRDWLVAIVS